MKKSHKKFWDAEYQNPLHLAISMKHSEDMEKWTRYMIRRFGKSKLNVTTSVLDLGCGNGRNILWLAEQFHIHGTGYDISSEAVRHAQQIAMSKSYQLSFSVRNLNEPIPLPDNSQNIVLDLMASHFLKAEERKRLIAEIHRVLKPGGYLLYKTFLLDEDQHAARLIAEHPAGEQNSYIHPKMGVLEHVSTRAEIEELYEPFLILHEFHASHRHTGKNGKRRSVTVYAEKQ